MYLHRSATWRTIVVATRDPRVLAAFIVTTLAGGYAIGMGSRKVTDKASKETKEDIEKKLKRDVETARYANHSKNALAVLFEKFQPLDDRKDDPDAKYKKHEIKLPGVMWHPKVAQREKELTERAEQANKKNKGNGSVA